MEHNVKGIYVRVCVRSYGYACVHVCMCVCVGGEVQRVWGRFCGTPTASMPSANNVKYLMPIEDMPFAVVLR